MPSVSRCAVVEQCRGHLHVVAAVLEHEGRHRPQVGQVRDRGAVAQVAAVNEGGGAGGPLHEVERLPRRVGGSEGLGHAVRYGRAVTAGVRRIVAVTLPPYRVA